MPSEADNSPNTALECLARGLRILCSDSPGISELFADGISLVPHSASAWAERLSQSIVGGVPPAVPSLYPEQVIGMRLAFMEDVATARAAATAKVKPPNQPQARVSVIVPHYNGGTWLVDAVRSLAQQTDEKFDVTIVDDGTTCEKSRAIFNALEKGNTDSRFHFLRQQNGGVCSARNYGAARSSGELLMFMDADNIARPEMIATLRHRLTHAGLDVITCDLYAFDHDVPTPTEQLRHHRSFAGGPLEGALK